MPKMKPGKLTTKQSLMVADMVADLKQGRPINPTKSVEKVYDVSTKNSATTLAYENMNKPNIRNALLDGLRKEGIIGSDSKVERRLKEGLDAVKKTSQGNQPAYNTRLNYIKEINKITGVYAPEQKQIQSMNVNLSANNKELSKKIRQLEEELNQ